MLDATMNDGESTGIIWCSDNDCDSPSCHRCSPRLDCTEHEKCREHAKETTKEANND